MVAGPNGSGKTTLTNELRRSGIDFGYYINPDDIARNLTSGSEGNRTRLAQRVADDQRNVCLQRRISFSFETVMSHPSKVEILRGARKLGYQTALYFVATENPSLNVARVAQRVALGGHDVPEDKIRERYTRTLKLLWPAMLEADRFVLFDNSAGLPGFRNSPMKPFCEGSLGLVKFVATSTLTWAEFALREARRHLWVQKFWNLSNTQK